MTAAELYELSPELRAFISTWVEHREVPLPLIDWLEEQGLSSQSEAAKWAYEMPDREVYCHPDRRTKSYPHLHRSIDGSIKYQWGTELWGQDTADRLWWLKDPNGEYVMNFDTTEDALLFLLDSYPGQKVTV